jgi:hypothetical protein
MTLSWANVGLRFYGEDDRQAKKALPAQHAIRLEVKDAQIGRYTKVLKNVIGAGKTRQNSAKNRGLWVINKHVEPNVYAVWPSATVLNPC